MEKQQKRRLKAVLYLFAAILLVFCVQLIQLQVVKGADYLAQSIRKNIKTETVDAARGEILDRNGVLMVSNTVSYQVTLDIGQMGVAREETLLTLTRFATEAGLAWTDTLPISAAAPYVYTKERAGTASRNRYENYLDLMGLKEPVNPQELIDTLAEAYGLSDDLTPQTRRLLVGILYECALRSKEVTWSDYYFLETVNMDFIARVKERNLPGVNFTPASARNYETPSAAHILGRVGRMSEEEWSAYQDLGYDMDAVVGKDGVERAFEAYLHGKRGERTTESDGQGKVVSETYTTRPQPGSNVVLTIDLGLQERTEEVLAEQIPLLESAEGAAVAIIDVSDGGVLTLASYPTFDLGQFSALYNDLVADPLQPMFNRALQGIYAPGSTYKMVTAVAALEEGIITPETQILDTGRYTYYSTPQPLCWIFRQTGKTHGLETVTEAITDSCNIFFYDVGRRLGITKLVAYAEQFGLGEKTGVELAGENRGVVAGPAYTRSLGQTWYDGSTLSAAIGQENNQFTPLQMASYVSTLVNGGNRYETHLLKEVWSNDGKELLETHTSTLLGTVSISEENLLAVKEGMLAVTEEGSVATYFRNLDVKVGAKTGSAQVTGNEESNAVFVCFAPYDDPQVAIAIVVEKGGSGSELGRIAADILDYYFRGKASSEKRFPILPAQSDETVQ